jgi:hypothetical protein
MPPTLANPSQYLTTSATTSRRTVRSPPMSSLRAYWRGQKTTLSSLPTSTRTACLVLLELIINVVYLPNEATTTYSVSHTSPSRVERLI